MSGEIYSSLFEILFKAGANDVFLTNIIMKKNRPGVKLSVLVKEELVKKIEKIIFIETTTLGIRRYSVNKTTLNREFETIETPVGDVLLKKGFYQGKLIKSKPEYEDCKRISREKNIPLKDVYDIVQNFISLRENSK